MITLQQFSDSIDELLQPGLFTDSAINGLQVEGSGTITRFATAVSASLESIEAAVAFNAEALIVHHGLFWNRDSHAIIGTKKDKIALLLKHNISLLAYHLPLDAHTAVGNNWKAARDMGWTNLQPFGMINRIPLGVKGELPVSSRQEFKALLESYYRHPAHCALGGKEQVGTAALISGGAHKQILDAAAEGVDCFITGSFDEPVWIQSFEEKINFFALGHAATERIGVKALGEFLAEKWGLHWQFIPDQNPF